MATTQSVYQIGFNAGVECARDCAENAGEKHKGQPIWPGDFECVAEKMGCKKHSIDEHLENDRNAIRELWNGFEMGVQAYNESPQLREEQRVRLDSGGVD